jgi:hypothetical protein
MHPEDLRILRHRIARGSISRSTLRGQGAKGVVACARQYLEKVRLWKYSVDSREDFLNILNIETKRLQKSLPKGAQNWGAARKAINIFLREVLYNHHLARSYQLRKIERFLEVPLDGNVGRALCRTPEGRDLPRWTTIKSLTKGKSDLYQAVARRVARRRNSLAIHLDLHCMKNPDVKL